MSGRALHRIPRLLELAATALTAFAKTRGQPLGKVATQLGCYGPPVSRWQVARYLAVLVVSGCCVFRANARDFASDEHGKNAVELHRQAHAITRGVDHSRATCVQVLPLLERALDEQLRSSGPAAQEAAIRTDLGRCMMALEDWASAAVHLRVALDKAPRPLRSHVFAGAQFLLASLYDKGLGVSRDPERALGLYLSSELEGRDAYRRDRAAAELMLELNGGGVSPMVLDLLERQSASNWWRALELRRGSGEHQHGLARRALIALKSIQGVDDERAWRKINLVASLGLLASDGTERLPAAWLFLWRSQHGDEASLGLQKLKDRWPVRIVNTDGSNWSMEDGAH